MKLRVVRSKMLAGSLVWLGFEYSKDEEGNYLFERTYKFDKAWDDLHYLKSIYNKPLNK